MAAGSRAGAVAIVGMAGRFPGARNLRDYWRNLSGGVESVSFFSPEELRAAGVAPHVMSRPDYVPAAALVEDPDLFDASFFGYSPRDAEIMDPQQRVLLECAWECLEDAGHAKDPSRERIGVFVGASAAHYAFELYSNRDLVASVDDLHIIIANSDSHAATRISYKLGLRGPSVFVQTACSTSLTAVHLACQSLLHRECDMALAGGVSITVPRKSGYMYREGGILSPDGHCRAFDAAARGTVVGNGVGTVLLKRYDDAVGDGDAIRAVVLGSAMNNDGAGKVGYTAPSIDGQVEVIVEAQAVAGVDPRSIQYVETHGTGTALGDPIEVEALTRAFRLGTRDRAFCGIGSVKSNFGHLLAAAGAASLVKTVLALEHGWMPASLHVREPNPRIAWNDSPFHVVTDGRAWPRGAEPRRAGVSSFGIGGTNVHVVLEEAQPRAERRTATSGGCYVLRVSGRTPAAVRSLSAAIADEIDAEPALALEDAAFTLREGRKRFGVTRLVACRDRADAVAALRREPAADEQTASWDGPPDEIRSGRRVPLPTYPFERRRYWAAAAPPSVTPDARPSAAPRVDDWFHVPEWTLDVTTPPGRIDRISWAVVESGAAGRALAAALAAHGAGVQRIARGDIVSWLGSGPATPRVRLVDACGLDEPQGSDPLARLLDVGQAAARRTAEFELVVLTRGAARVGSEPLRRPDGAAVQGAVKVIGQELRHVRARTVDVAADPAADDLDAIVDELARWHGGEVALRGRDRWVRTFRRLALAAGRASRVRNGGVYLVTGGTSGIGLAIAEWLAREARDVRLVLVGRRGAAALSAAQQEAIAGWPAAVRIEAVDVGDPAAVASLVTDVRERWGRIDGVVHAAGVAGGGVIAGRTASQVADVLRPKVAGTRNLAAVLADAPLDFFVVTSSIAALRGGFGQFDYAAANAWLDAWAAAAPPAWHAVSINWAAWAETGMALDAVRRQGYLPCPLWLQRAEVTDSAAPVHPLVGRRLDPPADRAHHGATYVATLNASAHWPIGEHQVAGQPALCGTSFLEMARAAWTAETGLDAVEMRDVAFTSLLTTGPGEDRPVHVVLTGSGGDRAFSIASAEAGDGESRLIEHARGVLREAHGARPGRVNLDEVRQRCNRPFELASDPALDTGLLRFGPRWRCLRGVSLAESEALAVLELADAHAADLRDYRVHPAVLDVALGCGKLIASRSGQYLPLAYGRVVVHGAFTRRVLAHVRLRGATPADAPVVRFDATICDEQGDVLVEVEEYTLRRVTDRLAASALRSDRYGRAVLARGNVLEGAILTRDGLDAFGRILAHPALRQVCVSPMPIEALLAEWDPDRADFVGRIEQLSMQRSAGARPELATPYEAPRNDVERRLCAVWESLLGLDRVGVRDDFFELGGDSLLGIQAAARIREQFSVEMSPTVLFDCPTVEQLAARVAASLAERLLAVSRAGAGGAV